MWSRARGTSIQRVRRRFKLAPPTPVPTLHVHWPPDRFAELIAAVARLYPELSGNRGLATIPHCRQLGLKGLYAERPALNKAGVEIEPGKLGWLTSSVTKPPMIDALEEVPCLFQIELRDATSIPDLTFYQTQKGESSGVAAGQWDDRVIRLAATTRPAMPEDGWFKAGGGWQYSLIVSSGGERRVGDPE